MANPHRGEVELVTKDKRHVLRFTMNAICELEDHLGESSIEIAKRLQQPELFRMKIARAMIWAGLLDASPDLTLEEAGTIADELGLAQCMSAVGTAFALAFPKPDKAPARRPQKPVRG